MISGSSDLASLSEDFLFEDWKWGEADASLEVPHF